MHLLAVIALSACLVGTFAYPSGPSEGMTNPKPVDKNQLEAEIKEGEDKLKKMEEMVKVAKQNKAFMPDPEKVYQAIDMIKKQLAEAKKVLKQLGEK